MARHFETITIAALKKKIEKYMGVEGDIRPLLDVLKSDIKVKFDTENVYYEPNYPGDILGYHTLSNKLTFFGVESGGDWEQLVFFIVYWDGRRLRGYVPREGNPWNTDTMQSFGNDDEADQKNARKRWPDVECPEDLTGWFTHDNKEIKADILKRIRPRGEPEKTVKLPMVRVAEVNTEHITKTDNDLLTEFANEGDYLDGPTVYLRGKHGFIILVRGHDKGKRSATDGWEASGFSTEFCQLYESCLKQKVTWLMIDGGAATVKGLPSFDW